MPVVCSKPIILGTCAALVLALGGAAQPGAEEPLEAATSEAASDESAIPSIDSEDFLAPDPEAAEPEAEEASADPAIPDGDDAPAEAAPSTNAGDVPLKGKPPTRAFLIGVWAEKGKSCEAGIDFKPDGTMIGPFPRWELNDDGELTMVGNRQKIWLAVVDKNTMHSRRSEKDPPRTLKRC